MANMPTKLNRHWLRPTLPQVLARINEDCPKGFVFERQVLHGPIGPIKKTVEKQHGADNCVVLPGHWVAVPQEKRGAGPKDPAMFLTEGCRVYVRAAPPKKKRPMIKVNGRDTEAWEPDYSRKCKECDAGPVVPQTGLCALCQWGDSKIDADYK